MAQEYKRPVSGHMKIEDYIAIRCEKVLVAGLQIQIAVYHYDDTFRKYVRRRPRYGIYAILFSKREFALLDFHSPIKF